MEQEDEKCCIARMILGWAAELKVCLYWQMQVNSRKKGQA
jgi:hypothetical protein